MVADARKEARANGATKYQQDKISKEIKATYGSEKNTKLVKRLLKPIISCVGHCSQVKYKKKIIQWY